MEKARAADPPQTWRLAVCALLVVSLLLLSGETAESELRCALLIFAVLVLQLSGVVPLYCVGLVVPVLGTLFRALPERGPTETARACFSAMMNPMTALVLGSFTVNSIFLCCKLEVACVGWIANTFGSRPRTFLLVLMLACMYSSALTMVTLIALAAVLPLTKDGGATGTKSVPLGIGFACTLGGMLTPIAGPPALILTSVLAEFGVQLSFKDWMLISVPLLTVVCVVLWAVLLYLHGTPQIDMTRSPRNVEAPLTRSHWALIGLSLLFLAACIGEEHLRPYVGDSGNCGLLLTAVAFSSGFLTKADFLAMPWDVFFVLFGVNSLSFCLKESGLARALAASLVPSQLYEVSLWLEVVKLSALATLAGSFMSHSMVATLTMPVIVALGLKLYSPVLVALLVCLSIVVGMGTPYSSLDILMTWQFGEEKAGMRREDFVRSGVPATVAGWLTIVTVGYGWAYLVLGPPPQHIIIREPQELTPSVEVWNEDDALDDKLRWLERRLDDPSYAVRERPGAVADQPAQGDRLAVRDLDSPAPDMVLPVNGLATVHLLAKRHWEGDGTLHRWATRGADAAPPPEMSNPLSMAPKLEPKLQPKFLTAEPAEELAASVAAAESVAAVEPAANARFVRSAGRAPRDRSSLQHESRGPVEHILLRPKALRGRLLNAHRSAPPAAPRRS